MAFYANGFTTFGAYKKIGGALIEAKPIEPAAGVTGQIDVDSVGDTANVPANMAGAGFIILEGEAEGAQLAIPVLRVNRV